MKKKVFVGLSGGVDSAVSAALLLEAGYDVTGVFMKNWSGEDYGIADQCPWEKDLADSIDVCKTLGIPHKTYNFEKEYRELVIENFFQEYSIGNTPNPDILCNKFIKFDLFLKRALSEGADFIATGHYSKIKNGRLYKATDTKKDQTYFLYQVTSDQLKHTLFPLGELIKSDVRKLAIKFNLSIAQKPDSQGICFIGEIDIVDFLKSNLKEKKGDILDIDSKRKVGEHIGIWFYTIGQRKGIGVGGMAEPYFICDKDLATNILYVAKGKKHPALWGKEVVVDDFHFIDGSPATLSGAKLTAMIRYRAKDSEVKAEWFDSDKGKKSGRFTFAQPQWAPAIGQSLVLFNGEECLGGGILGKT